MTDFVAHEVSDHVATVTIQRPDKLNALNPQVIAQLDRCFAALAEDPAVRCAIFTGEGRAFIAGADIGTMQPMTAAEARRFSATGHAFAASLEALPFPVIAAVNGFCLGGGLELAMACDFIYASEKAKLGQPEVSLGVIPGFGGTQRLTRRVGAAMARELCYTGAMIDAGEALRIGLVNRVTAPEALLGEARATAETIAKQAPLAVGAAKRVILRGEGMALTEANELETQAFGGLFGSEDQRQGMTAFLAKEKTTFQGR
ncbi:MAG: enoyl-CoA hydratase/isomerase family protein [Myxococcales bacterium]|nr:enoyl-CoA hydratase/isomerase family protein [Myxococcales bacterium]